MSTIKLYGIMRVNVFKGDMARNSMVNLSGLVKPSNTMHWTLDRGWAEDVMKSKVEQYPDEKYIIVSINDPLSELVKSIKKRK